MKAVVFNIRLNSLFSIRIPFTWQSALTYPVLPPSAVIGLLANALQRYKNNAHPLEYLDLIENEIIWAGSKLLTPCVIKSYTVSAIVKWKDKLGGKFTNALGRQFAYAKNLQISAIFRSESSILETIKKAISFTPLTCGDSESPLSLESPPEIENVTIVTNEKIVRTEYPTPFSKDTEVEEGDGELFLMHERCRKNDSDFPLVEYLVPVRAEDDVLKPSYLKIILKDEGVFSIENVGYVITRKKANLDQ